MFKLTQVQVVKYDELTDEAQGRALVIDSRGSTQEIKFQTLDASDDVITDISGDLHEIAFNDLGPDDADLGYVFSEYDPAVGGYVPVAGEKLFLAEEDYELLLVQIAGVVGRRVSEAHDAARIAFNDVLLR